jgi:DNA-binding SARP family transcriptional activator
VVHGLGLVIVVLAAAGAALDGPTATAVARLAGAVHGLRTRAGVHLDDATRGAESRALDAAVTVLGADAVRLAAAAGRLLTAAEAVGEALAVIPPDLLASSGSAPPLGTQPPHDGRSRPAHRDASGTPPAGSVRGPAPEGPLRTHVLGPLRLERGDRSLLGMLPMGKATELLLLLVARPAGVTREQAGLALWPDASAAQVRNVFHVTLHHVRRALAGADRVTAAPVTWVVYADGRYRLVREASPGLALDCDLDAVLAAADRLRRAERRREALGPDTLDDLADALERARRGAFGAGASAGSWVDEVEDTVRAAWAEGTQLLARQHARSGRYAAGVAALEIVVARDPLRESAHRELLALLAASGDRARALHHYNQLAAALRREAGAEPARETRALVDQIRNLV